MKFLIIMITSLIFITIAKTKNKIAIYFVQRDKTASKVLALFLEKKVSAAPVTAPTPAR
jgi:hypothetical protein